MEAWLRSSDLWRLVSGKVHKPTLSQSPSDSEIERLEKWEIKADRAAGWIYLMVEPDQRIHFNNIRDDPIKMWAALESVHLQKRPGARFNAYDDLFSIRKQEDETLQMLMNRVDQAMHSIKDLRPAQFTLADLDNELASMSLIRALPSEQYGSFTSSLLLLDKLDKATIHQAFVTEETQRRRRAGDNDSQTQAMATTHKFSKPLHCDFCGKKNHTTKRCYLYLKAQKQAKEDAKNANSGEAKQAQEAQQDVKEFAGNASRSLDPSDPNSPLQLDADFDWNADTGATSHMTPHRHWIHDYTQLSIPIKLADNTIIYSAGVGTVIFNPVVRGKSSRAVAFTRVLHVPKLRNNLLSCLYLTRHKGFEIHITSNHMDFLQSKKIIFSASINSNNAAYLDGVTQPISEFAHHSSTLPLDLNLWHRRLAHHNYADVRKMIREDMVTGLVLDAKRQPDPICEPCLAGKMHSNPFPSSENRASHPLELIHSDLHGPLPVRTHSGFRYWITFIDDCVRFRVVMLLKAKNEAFAAFQKYKAWAENMLGLKIKCLQDDKGGEYMSTEFLKFTDDCGIERRHTTRNRPQQNGVAERANRTMADDITAMLTEAKLPASFWGECAAAMVHVWNRLPTAALPQITPYEGWYKRKPDVSHLRVWGCTAYVYVQKDKRKSLEPHMEKCVFIGYPEGYKGWRFYNPTTKKTIISECAEFDERYFPGLSKSSPPLHAPPVPPVPMPPMSVPVLEEEDGDGEVHPIAAPHVAMPPAPQPPHMSPPPSPQMPPVIHRVPTPPPLAPAVPASPPLALRRPQRNTRPPGEWWTVRKPTPQIGDSDSDDELDVIDADFVDVQFAGATGYADPRSFKIAMKTPEATKWQDACNEEIIALNSNRTWDIVELPPDKVAIGSGWVFRVKRHADGSIERYKARLVAKGYSQRPGFDYTEVFAPTFRQSSLRLILAISAIEDLELRSVDISSAFLNGDLEEEIYMKQAEGFHEGGPNHVCRLKKSLYGLKQAARQWNKKLHTTLQSMGFKRLDSDRSIYVYVKDDLRIIVPIFIDDITLASKSSAAIDKAVHDLSQHFKLRDLGPTKFLLGVEIIRDRSKHTLALSQRQYIIDMLERFKMSDCKPVSTPMTPGLHLTKDMGPKTEEEVAAMSSVPYLSAVGSLSFAALFTRPDIAFAVGYLACFNSNPGPAHWLAVKHLFRYMKGTLDYKLVYRPDPLQQSFLSYSDADFAGDKDNGKSTGGYVIKLGTGAISWSSKLQSIVTLSTTEAEYISGVETGKEMLWTRNILSEFGYTVDGASPLLMDNQSAINVSKNPEHHGRMKHLDLRFYWLRDTVESGLITPSYIPTSEMAADILTKALPLGKLDNCRKLMGLEA